MQKDIEEEEELFKDVDPKTLAAVLLESLNHSQVERSRKGDKHDGMEEDMEAETGDIKKEEANRIERMMERGDRDEQLELELLLAAQGKEQEEEKEKEMKKAKEEEEKITEKVKSHTTSQNIHVQMEQQSKSPEEEVGNGQGVIHQGGPNRPEHGDDEKEEEEQLSPEELKSLETVMKVFPRLNTATKREEESEQNERESRGYSSYNDIIPLNKDNSLAMSKKKLKWQEETQKALNFPTFTGNFREEFEDNNYAGSNSIQSQSPVDQESIKDDEPEEGEDEEDEDVLSPEEEEAQAKAEQEEMRRQAAEAQRAKMEEEKLADIASDMLLHYMGNKKYSSSLSNAVEDKRSDEEQEMTEEDDIDPQTIDKLIEISSKLHLPADDVVDIISDVEKKKKKDMPSEVTSHQQRPQVLLSSSLSSANGLTATPVSTDQNRVSVSKQPSPAFNLLKTWFQEKSMAKSQDRWGNPAKPPSANKNLWPKPPKPLSVKEDLWFKSPKSGYSFYPYTYTSYYRKKPYPLYHPIYFPPSPRLKPNFYIPKSTQTINNFLGNSVGESYALSPKNRLYSWVQPRLRKLSTGLQHRPYYRFSLYPWTFQPVPIPRPRSPPHFPVIPPQQKQFYYPALEHPVMGNDEYYVSVKQPETRNRDDVEKHIQQILMKKLQIGD